MANPKGNPQNLTKPGDPRHHVLTKEDCAKGGARMGENKKIANLLNEFDDMKVDIPEIRGRLKKFGISEDKATNAAAIAARIIIGARSGNPKMVELYLEASGQKKVHNVNENHNIEYKPLVDLTKRKKNGED